MKHQNIIYKINYMKNFLIMMTLSLMVVVTSCKKTDFADSYADPSKISVSNIEKQYAGFLKANSSYVLPDYWNYFVVLRTTTDRYTQATGYTNVDKMYVPGDAGIGGNWDTYYNLLAQYRELQKIYAASSATDQAAKKIFITSATIYLYDFTQKLVDLHGSIPFSAAGNLSTNGGDYLKSLPKYDDAAAVYTKMLDDLKSIADELSSTSLTAATQTAFTNQDFVNGGNISKWKIYCNSLRLRMLTRVSGASAFTARYTSETAAILSNPSAYPVVSSNTDNIEITVKSVSSNGLNSSGFQSGLEDWNHNIASKTMIDYMKTNTDPRLRILFEPGTAAAGAFTGLDQLAANSVQDALIAGGTISIYNRSTLSRNKFFPGVLINAAEVSFLKAESYLKAGNATAAKAAYEAGVRQSAEFYFNTRSISGDNTAGTPAALTTAEVNTYLAQPAISWDAASTTAAKWTLIAYQKWVHFNVVQSLENWAETRRLKLVSLSFKADPTAQSMPPARWFYPSGESVYNTANYGAVKATDNLTTKLFWDTK
jgi:Starch-binding associating with outer membrane